MNVSIEKLKDNWEFCVLTAVLTAVILIFILHFFSNTENQTTAIMPANSLESKNILSKNSFDFLEAKKALPEGNPFTLPVEAPPAPTPPRPKIQSTPPRRQTQKTPEPEPETKIEKVIQQSNFTSGEIQFILRGSTASAKTMAIVKLTADGIAKNIRLGIGEEYRGMKIIEINSNIMVLQDAKGTNFEIQRGAKRKIVLLRKPE